MLALHIFSIILYLTYLAATSYDTYRMLKGKETANTSWAIEIAIPALLLGFTWGKVDILAGVAILMAASVLINELVQDVIYAKTLEQIMQRTEEHKDI